jgi:hypothetical protein
VESWKYLLSLNSTLGQMMHTAISVSLQRRSKFKNENPELEETMKFLELMKQASSKKSPNKKKRTKRSVKTKAKTRSFKELQLFLTSTFKV